MEIPQHQNQGFSFSFFINKKIYFFICRTPGFRWTYILAYIRLVWPEEHTLCIIWNDLNNFFLLQTRTGWNWVHNISVRLSCIEKTVVKTFVCNSIKEMSDRKQEFNWKPIVHNRLPVEWIQISWQVVCWIHYTTWYHIDFSFSCNNYVHYVAW